LQTGQPVLPGLFGMKTFGAAGAGAGAGAGWICGWTCLGGRGAEGAGAAWPATFTGCPKPEKPLFHMEGV
jgi:hypothetical protein